MSKERIQPYTVTELAEEAAVSVAYVRRLVADGKIEGRKVGPLWTIPADEARRFIQKRRRRWEKF